MRVFNEPNISNNWSCMICKTADIKPVVLVGIEGTQEGFNIQAEQVHLECLELTYNKNIDVIYQGVQNDNSQHNKS